MKSYLGLAIAAVLSLPVAASATTFTFGNGPDSETYSDTVDGITLSASAGFYAGSTIQTTDADGLFGRELGFSNAGIGVDGPADSEDIDGRFRNDLLTFTFSEKVNFKSVQFGNVDLNDDFDMFVDGVFVAPGEFNIAAQNPYDLSGLVGTSISFGADDGGIFTPADNFRIKSITVAAIPLPAGGLLLLTGLGAALVLRRRKS